MKKILLIAKKYKLKVIEDACMAIGGKLYGKSPGNFGDVGAYSMHPLKTLNVIGDGGMITTNNYNVYKWMIKYRNHGMVDRDHINIWGVNMRLQPFQAIVALEQMKNLNNIIKIPKRLEENTETFSLYILRVKNRNKLKNFLIKKGIECKIHYPVPLHKQKAHLKSSYIKEDGYLPEAETQAKEIITLPMHQYLNKKQLNYMYKSILEFYK